MNMEPGCKIMNPAKPSILIVDDTPENIDVLKGVLGDQYDVRVTLDGPTALDLARQYSPNLILLDIMMPGMDGFEVCQQLKANIKTKPIPVIFVTAKNDMKDETHGFAVGAVDFIAKPISPAIVLARVNTHLQLHDQQRALTEQVRQRTAELENTRLQIVQRLGRAAEYKDNETGLHVIRMSHYTRMIASGFGLSNAEADLLFNAAPMHDIGKLGIPDYILQKPGKLSEDEWALMKLHPVYGAQIIGDDDSTDLFTTARSIALTHHEKWNGLGYPYGLKTEEIPLEGRIVAVADVFDALTSERPYKKAWPVKVAADLMESESGKHFDPELIKVFLSLLPNMVQVRERYSECEKAWEKKKAYWANSKVTGQPMEMLSDMLAKVTT